MRLTTRCLGTALLSVLLILVLTPSTHAAAAARAALERTTPSIRMESVTLKDALEFVQDIAAANLHVNWKALEAAGVGKDATISLHLRGVPLRKALSIILSEAAGGSDSLTFYVEDNVIEITTRELADKVMITRIYPVGDLLVEVPDFEGPSFNLSDNNSNATRGGRGSSGSSGSGSGSGLFNTTNTKDEKSQTGDERAQQLIDLITSLIRPDIWQANGGTASIRFFNGSLIVTAPRSVHEAIDGPVD